MKDDIIINPQEIKNDKKHYPKFFANLFEKLDEIYVFTRKYINVKNENRKKLKEQ